MSNAQVSRELLELLVDDEPCWFDHNGGCQAHGYLSLDAGEGCPQNELKRLLAATSAPVDCTWDELDAAETVLRARGTGHNVVRVLAEYDRRASEIERLGDALAEADQRQTRTDDQIGETRDGVMAAIEAAGLAPHVCDDDDLPDMVRHALTAAKRLAQPALAPEPGYERIADAIDDALKSADLRIELRTGTGSDWGRFTDSYSRELYVLARCLDKAGLIDWSAFGPEGAA